MRALPELSRRDFARLSGCVVGAALFGPDSLLRGRVDRQAWAGPASGRRPFEVVVERDVKVTMRDGVRLAADVYRPALAGRAIDAAFPTILERTPYGKAETSRSEWSVAHAQPKTRTAVAEMFVRRGYVVVYQDCRGRYGSEGTFRKYIDEAADGFDTCRWILGQPWCDGRIGTKGLSYAAHTQVALASAGAPGLAAMFVDSGGFSNAYQGGIRQGGAFELKQATWAYRNALVSPPVRQDSVRQAAMEAIDIHDWFQGMPWTPGRSPVSLAPDYEEYLFEQWTRGAFDEYWKRPGLWAEGFWDEFPDCPQLHMSGWYDPYSRTATENYIGLSRRKKGPVRLIVGPWTHGDRSVPYAGDVDFGPDAILDGNLAEDLWELRLRWFDHWLRGEANGVNREPAVRIFVMGGGSGRRNTAGRLDHGGRWREATDWPILGTRLLRLYLHGDRRLAPEEPEAGAAPIGYEYDPEYPVPTIGGTITSGRPIMEGGAYDQREAPEFFGSRTPYRPLSERPDVLAFLTEPLEEDVEVTGPIVVYLWISSDVTDTDFTAKLVDVYPPNEDYPDGYAMNLTDGILRVRYRDSWERPRLMTPGEVYRVRIDAFPTSNLFVRGHRIRLDVSSSNFPHFDLNFNTGEPEGRATHARVARNRVHMDRDRPSHLVLPVPA
jgi:putative CocE/NonD family hydrolase